MGERVAGAAPRSRRSIGHPRAERTRPLSPFLACLVALVLVPSSGLAKDMRGKLGVGAATTLAGAQGVTIRYWPTRSVGVELLGGVTASRLSNDAKNRTAFATAVQVIYAVRELGPANLLVGLRGDLAWLKDGAGAGVDQTTGGILHFALELPLTVEYHLSDAFALQFGAGLVLSFVPSKGTLLGGGALYNEGEIGEGISLGFGSGGAFGSAGFTFYF